MTIEDIKDRPEGQTFDCKSVKIEPKALAVPIVAMANAETAAMTREGQFTLQAPHSDTPYYLHLTTIKSGQEVRMVADADEYPDSIL